MAVMTVENHAFKVLIISFLLITALSFSRIIFAQEMPDSEIAPGGAITEDVEPATTDNGFSLLWLLPLIAVPVLLYFAWPRNKANRMDLSQGYVGAKGGRSQRYGSMFRTESEWEKKL